MSVSSHAIVDLFTYISTYQVGRGGDGVRAGEGHRQRGATAAEAPQQPAKGVRPSAPHPLHRRRPSPSSRHAIGSGIRYIPSPLTPLAFAGAVMVAKFCQSSGDFPAAIEFLLMARRQDEAFELAQVHRATELARSRPTPSLARLAPASGARGDGALTLLAPASGMHPLLSRRWLPMAQVHEAMDTYAQIVGQAGQVEDYEKLADYYEKKQAHAQAGDYYEKCGKYPQALRHYLK
eukprot:1195836-Prorocentrum_minimum.AAC.2